MPKYTEAEWRQVISSTRVGSGCFMRDRDLAFSYLPDLSAKLVLEFIVSTGDLRFAGTCMPVKFAAMRRAFPAVDFVGVNLDASRTAFWMHSRDSSDVLDVIDMIRAIYLIFHAEP